MQFFRKKLNKKGFTLIELIVVIAILAILAAIAVPRLLGFQERAEAQADKQSAVQIRNALALLHANGEILVAGTSNSVTIAPKTNVTAAGNITVGGGITPAPGSSNVDALIFALTGAFQLKGPQGVEVQIGNDGQVTVLKP